MYYFLKPAIKTIIIIIIIITIFISLSSGTHLHQTKINSMRPRDAYMRLYNIPKLFGTKPLSEPMLPYCQLDPNEQT